MKTLKMVVLMVVGVMIVGMNCNAQTSDVTVIVKGIKEAKGKIMVAAGDVSKWQKMLGDMKTVFDTDTMTCVLKNVPIGKTNFYVFQDLNENFQLDRDESNVPVEPCCTKNGVTIKDGENRIELKLINVKEMMGNSLQK